MRNATDTLKTSRKNSDAVAKSYGDKITKASPKTIKSEATLFFMLVVNIWDVLYVCKSFY